jgi:ketosteroid isomerase-like protein
MGAEMSLIENAATTIDRQWPQHKVIQMPKLSLAVRESAARAMNEPRFQSTGGTRMNTQFATPLEPVSPVTASRGKISLIAFCTMCIGALLMYAWMGTQSVPADANASVVAAPPAAAPPAAAASAPADTRALAADLIGQWAAAWSRRDVEGYIAFYSKQFVPPENLTREAWQKKRRERILSKQEILVTIDDLNVDMIEGNRAIARFAQTYEADKYRESRAPKTLILAFEDNAWRIAAEINSRDAMAQKR